MSPFHVLGFLCLVSYCQSQPVIAEHDKNIGDAIEVLSDDSIKNVKSTLDSIKGLVDGALNTDTEVGVMNQGMNILKENMKNFEKLDKLAKSAQEEADQKIAVLVHTIGKIETEKIAITKETVNTYLKGKSKLRNARQRLRRLAVKTISTMKQFEVYMDSWDPEDPEHKNVVVYYKEQIYLLKKLLTESKSTISEVQSVYDEVMDDMERVEHNLRTIQLTIKQQKGLDREEFEAWATRVRAGVYSTIGVSTTACIIADILGALGICSLINAAVSGSTAAGIEVNIADVKAELDRLDIAVKSADKTTKTLMVATNAMQKYVTEEIDLIDVWEEAVFNLDEKLEDGRDYLTSTFASKRKVFRLAVLDLKNAAQAFFKRPDFITELDQLFSIDG